MSSNKNINVAKAVGAITSSACQICIRKRARWYCAADDAFLCQPCDFAVHSVNPLARRHQLVRPKTASLKSLDHARKELPLPSWQHGFRRKTRTPRRHSKVGVKTRNHVVPLVPEAGSDEMSILSQEDQNNEEEHLLYRVPNFDLFLTEFCTAATAKSSDAGSIIPVPLGKHNEQNTIADTGVIESMSCSVTSSIGESIHGFIPSDTELAEFTANVESLFGKGLDDESFPMEGLGLLEYSHGRVKVEEDYEANEGLIEQDNQMKMKAIKNYEGDNEIDMGREPSFQFNFDCEHKTRATCGEDNEKVIVMNDSVIKMENNKRKILLSLDYEAVMTAWANQGSPWTTSNHPEFDPDEFWPDFVAGCGTALHHTHEDDIMGHVHPAMADGGREARVSRYREKRRSRMFSKKIRYQVRKLNAEKRPRMKGRFIKRASFTGAAAFPLLQN